MNNKTLIDTVINDLSIKDTDVLAQIRDALSKALKDCVVSAKPKTKYNNDEILDLYFSRMEYQNRSKGTIQQYKIVLLPFIKSIDKPIKTINEYDIKEQCYSKDEVDNLINLIKSGHSAILRWNDTETGLFRWNEI